MTLKKHTKSLVHFHKVFIITSTSYIHHFLGCNGWGFCPLWQQNDDEWRLRQTNKGMVWVVYDDVYVYMKVRLGIWTLCHLEVYQWLSVYQIWWWLAKQHVVLGLVCSDHESSESITSSCWFELTPLNKTYTRPKQQNGDIVTSFKYSWLLDTKHQEPLIIKSQNHRDFMASKPMPLPKNKNHPNWRQNSAHIYFTVFMCSSASSQILVNILSSNPFIISIQKKKREPKFLLPNHRSPHASCDHLDHRHVPHHPSPLHHWHWQHLHCCHQLKPWPEFTLRLYIKYDVMISFPLKAFRFWRKGWVMRWKRQKVKGDLLSVLSLFFWGGGGWNKHSKPCTIEVNHFVGWGGNWSHAKMLQETTTLPPGHTGNESQHQVENNPHWFCLKVSGDLVSKLCFEQQAFNNFHSGYYKKPTLGAS